MLIKTLATTAAVSMLVCGGSALAAQKTSSTQIGPKQPIPYAQLNAYLKASPKMRASKDWWAGSTTASTGMQTDTAATAPMPTADTAVNPSAMPAPPSMPVTPPVDATPLPSDPTQSTTPAAPPVTPPAEPK